MKVYLNQEKHVTKNAFLSLVAMVWIVFFPFKSFSDIGQKNKFSHFQEVYKKLNLTTFDGKKINLPQLSNIENNTIVIVNFWASWCIPCLEEIPSLIELTRKVKKDQFIVVAINTDNENQIVKINKTKLKLKIPGDIHIVADEDYKIADLFKIEAIPVTLFYKNGKVIQFKNGPVNFNPSAKEIPQELLQMIAQ